MPGSRISTLGGYSLAGRITILKPPYHDSIECEIWRNGEETEKLWFRLALWIGSKSAPGLLVFADTEFCPNFIEATRFVEAYRHAANIIRKLKTHYDAAEDKKIVNGVMLRKET